ncbi:hypothetical protein Tco_0145477 [Tanacetum coccineum]
MKNNCKENASNVFRKEREQYHEIQDLKAQMQDKNMVINELKKLILIVQLILLIVDLDAQKHMKGQSQVLCNFVENFWVYYGQRTQSQSFLHLVNFVTEDSREEVYVCSAGRFVDPDQPGKCIPLRGKLCMDLSMLSRAVYDELSNFLIAPKALL